jgi:hypothetical protein
MSAYNRTGAQETVDKVRHVLKKPQDVVPHPSGNAGQPPLSLTSRGDKVRQVA